MKVIKSTTEILVYKVLNRDIDNIWCDWAIDMLETGFDTEHLRILAGVNQPYNQFKLQDLTTKVLNELQLDFSDKEQTIKNYACYLIDKFLLGDMTQITVLSILKDICIEMGHEKLLYDFYLLYFAKYDLTDDGYQGYWEGADEHNIDKIINDYFVKWQTKYSAPN